MSSRLRSVRRRARRCSPTDRLAMGLRSSPAPAHSKSADPGVSLLSSQLANSISNRGKRMKSRDTRKGNKSQLDQSSLLPSNSTGLTTWHDAMLQNQDSLVLIGSTTVSAYARPKSAGAYPVGLRRTSSRGASQLTFSGTRTSAALRPVSQPSSELSMLARMSPFMQHAPLSPARKAYTEETSKNMNATVRSRTGDSGVSRGVRKTPTLQSNRGKVMRQRLKPVASSSNGTPSRAIQRSRQASRQGRPGRRGFRSTGPTESTDVSMTARITPATRMAPSQRTGHSADNQASASAALHLGRQDAFQSNARFTEGRERGGGPHSAAATPPQSGSAARPTKRRSPISGHRSSHTAKASGCNGSSKDIHRPHRESSSDSRNSMRRRATAQSTGNTQFLAQVAPSNSSGSRHHGVSRTARRSRRHGHHGLKRDLKIKLQQSPFLQDPRSFATHRQAQITQNDRHPARSSEHQLQADHLTQSGPRFARRHIRAIEEGPQHQLRMLARQRSPVSDPAARGQHYRYKQRPRRLSNLRVVTESEQGSVLAAADRTPKGDVSARSLQQLGTVAWPRGLPDGIRPSSPASSSASFAEITASALRNIQQMREITAASIRGSPVSMSPATPAFFPGGAGVPGEAFSRARVFLHSVERRKVKSFSPQEGPQGPGIAAHGLAGHEYKEPGLESEMLSVPDLESLPSVLFTNLDRPSEASRSLELEVSPTFRHPQLSYTGRCPAAPAFEHPLDGGASLHHRAQRQLSSSSPSLGVELPNKGLRESIQMSRGSAGALPLPMNQLVAAQEPFSDLDTIGTGQMAGGKQRNVSLRSLSPSPPVEPRGDSRASHGVEFRSHTRAQDGHGSSSDSQLGQAREHFEVEATHVNEEVSLPYHHSTEPETPRPVGPGPDNGVSDTYEAQDQGVTEPRSI